MRRSKTFLVGAMALSGLVGCVAGDTGGASPPAPAAQGASAPVAGSAGTRLDGTYTGVLGAPSASGSGTGSTCYQSGTPQTLRVVNGRLRGGIFFRQFDGPIGADGSVNATGADTRNNGNPGTIEGRVTPTNIDATFTYRVGSRTTCTYSLSGLTRS